MADENSDEPYLRDPETGEINTREVRHRAKSWIAVLVAFGVFAVGIWFVGTRVLGWWDGVRSAEDYIGEGKADIVVTIPKGSSVSAIGQLLTEENVVKEPSSPVPRTGSTQPGTRGRAETTPTNRPRAAEPVTFTARVVHGNFMPCSGKNSPISRRSRAPAALCSWTVLNLLMCMHARPCNGNCAWTIPSTRRRIGICSRP